MWEHRYMYSFNDKQWAIIVINTVKKHKYNNKIQQEMNVLLTISLHTINSYEY